ncbi:unnamed protein product, partial [Polarella glacialis]
SMRLCKGQCCPTRKFSSGPPWHQLLVESRWMMLRLTTVVALARASQAVYFPGPAEHLWIDADPSGLVWTGLAAQPRDCDDDLALLAGLALNASAEIHLEGLSICGGNAPLSHTWADAHLLLQSVGRGDIQLSAGAGWRSMQVAWPSLRRLSQISPDMEDSDAAAKAIIAAAAAAPPRSLTILMLGPVTNLARALVLARSAHGRRADGPAPRPELHDGSGCCESCDQQRPSAHHAGAHPDLRTGHRDASLRRAFREDLLPWRRCLRRWPEDVAAGLDEGFIPWDVVALLAAVRPALFEDWEYLAVELPPCEGGEPCNGTMTTSKAQALPQDTESWASGLVLVPQRIRDEGQLLEAMLELFCAVPAVTPIPKSALLWGFLTPLALVALAALPLALAGACVCKLCRARRHLTLKEQSTRRTKQS